MNQPDINNVLNTAERSDWSSLKPLLASLDTADIATILERLPAESSIVAFRLLPPGTAARTFSRLNDESQERLLGLMADPRIREVLTRMSPDDRTDLLEDLPSRVVRRLLGLLSPDIREEALILLGYPEESCGRLMDPRFVAVSNNMAVSDCLDEYRKQTVGMDPPDVVFITDGQWRLLDEVPLGRLVAAGAGTRVEELLDGRVVSIEAEEDREEAVRIIRKYDLAALPVVNRNGKLLGVVTFDDIMDVQAEEATEDVDKTAAVIPLGESYASASPGSLILKRVPWLALLGVTGFLSGTVISAFENVLEGVLVLAAFIPMLIDTGGNTGSQSAALVIRAMALGELGPGSWFRVIRKELTVGLLLGLAVGVMLFLGAWLWKGDVLVGLTVGSAAFFIALWANLVGGLLPLAIHRTGLDPAVVSSPLITTLIDVTGLLIYFVAAQAILGL